MCVLPLSNKLCVRIDNRVALCRIDNNIIIINIQIRNVSVVYYIYI